MYAAEAPDWRAEWTTSFAIVSRLSIRTASLAADQPRRAQVGGVLNLGDDVVAAVAVAAALGQREDGLDHLRVRLLVVLGRENDDRACLLGTHQRQVVEVDRRAAAGDHPGPLRPHLLADHVVHLDLVAVGEDDSRGPLAALVGDLQLREDGEDRVRPAEDQGVFLLEDHRATLAHLFDPRVEAGGDDADQGADHEEAAEGDEEHHDQEGPVATGIAGDRARVERVQEALERLPDRTVRAGPVARRQIGDQDDRGEDGDHGQGGDRQPADQGRRPPRHRVVERVAKPLLQSRAPFDRGRLPPGRARTACTLHLWHHPASYAPAHRRKDMRVL